MAIIRTVNLVKKYKDIVAVDKVNLEIESGELFCLLGVNGAGKTTLIKMLSMISEVSDGKIYINEKDVSKCSNEVKEIINIAPQEVSVAMNLTVFENLEFFAGIYKIENKKKKIDELIKLFGLSEVIDKKACKLSGGFKRRLSIAIALINEPKILFLDEPTLALDVIAKREVWNIIKALKGNVTIILTTHYMEEAESLSDRVGIMKDGKLLVVGTPKELIRKSNAKSFEDAFVNLSIGGVR